MDAERAESTRDAKEVIDIADPANVLGSMGRKVEAVFGKECSRGVCVLKESIFLRAKSDCNGRSTSDASDGKALQFHHEAAEDGQGEAAHRGQCSGDIIKVHLDPAPSVRFCRVNGADGLATADEHGCGEEPLGRCGFNAAPIRHDIGTRASLEGLVDVVSAHLDLAVQFGAAAKAHRGRRSAHLPLQLLQAVRDVTEAEDFPRQLGGLQQSDNCPTDGLPPRSAR